MRYDRKQDKEQYMAKSPRLGLVPGAAAESQSVCTWDARSTSWAKQHLFLLCFD